MANDPFPAQEKTGFPVDPSDPAEIRYLKAMLSREFPAASVEAVNGAVEACRRQTEPFENRKELLKCARQHLLDAQAGTSGS